jgi:Protein of unknown function (DUF4242)
LPQQRKEDGVPRFLVERQFNVGQEQMDAVGRRSREILEERYPAVVWEMSHVAIGDDGRVQTFCLYSSPDEDQIREHAQELGMHEILRLSEIVGDVTPADFPS